MQDFEKLGLFYLGRRYDIAAGKTLDEPVLYDSRDLVTHAVCVGMTGSGKTGLCLALIEEAVIDGVPVLAIDPKGDLANLLLTFPRLAPEDFEPWVDPDEARRQGMTVGAFAQAEAEKWRKGLADWGQDGARIERLRQAAEFAVYTPGSSAGLPVSIMSSFAAPPASVRSDGEALSERAGNTATSVLALAGIDAQPRSREHTLLTALFGGAWAEGRDLDLPGLIQQVQSPPFEKIGVLDLEAFFPARDRFELATRAQRPARRARLRPVAGRRATGSGKPPADEQREAPCGDSVDRPPRRRRADVRRVARDEPARRVDADADGHVEPSGPGLHGRNPGLFPARGESSLQGAAHDALEAGTSVRTGSGPRDAEPGGPRLQGPGEHRHVVPGPAADRSRQGADAGRPRGRRRCPGPRRDGSVAVGARQAGVPAARRASESSNRFPVALGAVVLAWTPVTRSDSAVDGRVRSRKPEARGPRSGARGRGAEARGRGTEAGSRRAEARGWRTDSSCCSLATDSTAGHPAVLRSPIRGLRNRRSGPLYARRDWHCACRIYGRQTWCRRGPRRHLCRAFP